MEIQKYKVELKFELGVGVELCLEICIKIKTQKDARQLRKWAIEVSLV